MKLEIRFDTGFLALGLLISTLFACELSDNSTNDEDGFSNSRAVFLLIDEESIDNGNPPNNFSFSIL